MIRRVKKPATTGNRAAYPAPSEQAHTPGEQARQNYDAQSVALAELQTIYEHAPLGICLFDCDLRYIKINQRLANLSGRPVVEHVGRPLRELLPLLADVLEPILKSVVETCEPVKNLEMREPEPHPGCSARTARVSFHPVKDSEGRLIGINALVLDITEREDALRDYAEELERRVAERTATLQESVQSLEGVLYHVAHDLRAPLRAMQGLTTLLLEEYATRFDDEGRDYAARIVTAASRMDALIRDLLAYGRLGHVDLPLQKVDLEKLMKFALDALCDEVAERGAQIEIQHPLPPVHANELVLQQIVLNLLSNALKFVAPGVAPRVRIWPETSNDKIRLWMQDNGIGIGTEHQQRIFRVFERLHRSEDYPGTGIGLAIVYKGMERMGGSVGVQSQPGAGSRFWLEFPGRNEAAGTALPENSGPVKDAPLQK
ncbi:MAG TPA: ATP-binding protein [Verrucomicrobiae bacterium]|nr:ATP-binding protein [Verrucomicrobiae bacterium]